MGWQTDLFCNITFNRMTYNSISEVDDRIAELTLYIKNLEETLRDLALMTEPGKLLSLEDGESALYHLQRMVKESLEDLEEYYIERWKLEILRENWNQCHNDEGLAINPPENIDWRTAYLDGDFIKSIDRPNGYE